MTRPDRRALVDRRVIGAELDDLAANASGPDLEQAAMVVMRRLMKDGEALLRQRFDDGLPGLEAARGRAFLIDQVIRLLFDFAIRHIYRLANPTGSEHLAVVAVGGYGRGELAPFSDIDLLFLLPYRKTPRLEQIIEFILYRLWDLGLAVGHSVRPVATCIRLAAKDHTIATALLEARFLWGERALFDDLRQRFDKKILTRKATAFVNAKLAERDARHKRLGDSRYVVEPDLKQGKGALRDLHTLFWIGKFLYRVRTVDELIDKGVLSTAEARRFARTEAFLWTVRYRLHYLAGRAEERLTFDYQSDIAASLGYTDHAGTSGVERFMKHYYLTAKTIGDLTRIFCAHLEAEYLRKDPDHGPRLGLRRRAADGFVIDGDRLNIASDTAFRDQPVDMLRLFAVAQERGLDIHPQALRLITRNLRRIDDGLRHDAAANRLFLEMLTSQNDPELTLRRLNEAGVFGAFMRDFGRIVAQTQHDMYHVYTVDEHTIRAIGILSRIENGALADDHPLSSRLFRQAVSRRVLYVAVLLHDIAKGRGGDHSVLGAGVAEALGPRLGLDAAETEAVVWLVRNHLLMSNTAFKRDISDARTVADFAHKVKSPERLRLLLVLTVADIRAVGPTVWNGWKGALLRDLFYRAEEYLLGGLASGRAGQRIAAAKDKLRHSLKDWDDVAFEAYTANHYDSYWLSVPLGALERGARLIASGGADDQLGLMLHNPKDGDFTELTIHAADHAGLFARIAGALALAGASILDAKIFVTRDGMALDTFSIQTRDRKAFTLKKEIERIRQTLKSVMAGDRLPARELKRRSLIASRTRVFHVAPRVLLENEASETHTVIEVNGRDRPGLLFDLTRALFDLNLSISSAHIATFGEQAVDVFYVRDQFGHKVTHAAKLKAIEKRLLAVFSREN